MLNFNLSDDQNALRKRAREFAIKEVLPVAWMYDERDEVPLDLLKKAWEAGLMNGDIPKKYGGKGFGLVESAIVTEEIAAACPGVATSTFDNSLGMEPLFLSENEGLLEKYLPEILNNFKLICFATSEPGMGSDVSGIRCRAKKEGDDYILNGTKYWITNGGIADYMTVFATTDPELKHEGIGAFLVERDWEGVSTGKAIPKLGQRCSNTTALHFKDVRVPAENVIAPPGKGFVLAMKTFSRTRPIIGAFAVGAARSAMEYAIDYAKRRKAFGMPLSGFQAIQFKLAEMYQKVETSRLLVRLSAWEADQGLDPTLSASITKFYSTEAALETVNDAMQILGGYGYTRMFPLEKLLRDVRLLMIYEGTSEVQRVIVSGHLLNAFEPAMPPLDQVPMLGSRNPEEEASETAAWRCGMCGHVHNGDEPPEVCPYCFAARGAFRQVWPYDTESDGQSK